MIFHKKTLKNGLRLITIPLKDAKTVSILILVKTGSIYEKKEENGISHFLEHMIFKGTKKRPHTLDISKELDQIGAKFNAFTGKEYMGFYTVVNSRHLDIGLDVLSDMFLNSKIETVEIEREKGVIIEEIKMIYDVPMRYIEDLWEELLFGDQPAGWGIAGMKENIQKITRDMIKKHYLSHFLAKNTVVIMAGDFNEGIVSKKIEKYLKGIKTGEPMKIPVLKDGQTKPKILLHSRKTDQSHFVLGVRAYSFFHPDKYPLALLSVILGGNMSSRLFTRIRERRGLAYYVNTSVESYNDRGYLATAAGVDHKKLEEAIKIILREYRLISENISFEELSKAKEFLKGRMTIELEGPDDFASFVGGEEISTGEILTPESKCDKINKVTLKDVKRVARDIFQNKNLNLAVIGPHKDEKILEKILKL